METFTEFEEQATVPQKNFSDILSHAFNTYFKIIGWCMLGFVMYLILSSVVSALLEQLVGYDSDAMAENIKEASASGANINSLFNSMFDTPGFMSALGITSLFGVFIAPFFAAFIYMMHKANRGISVEFADLFIGFRENYLQYVLLSLISSIALSIGFMLCGIGFFFVLPFFFTAYPVILFENKSAMEALKKSFETGQKNYGTLLGVGFIVTIISIAGIILCGIGIIATLPFFYAAMYSAYIAFWGVPQLKHSQIKM